jgi:DNA-binding response OmpR family regulator
VIAMTAHAMAGDRTRCLDAGMDDYVTKPIRSQLLVEVLTRWIDQPPASAAVDLDPGASVIASRAAPLAGAAGSELVAIDERRVGTVSLAPRASEPIET